jgi:hypothetical protein
MGEEGKLVVLSSALPHLTRLNVIDGEYEFYHINSFNRSVWNWSSNVKNVHQLEYFNYNKCFKYVGLEKVIVYGDVIMKKPGKYWWRI